MCPVVSEFILLAENIFMPEGGRRFNLEVTFIGGVFLSNSLYSWLQPQATVMVPAVERIASNITN